MGSDVADRKADPLLALLLDSLLQTVPAGAYESPPPTLRADLLAATNTQTDTKGRQHPFPGFRRRFARLFDLSEEMADQVLAKMSAPAEWESLKTLLVHHFTPGPARSGAHAGLVRCQPGAPFPVHRHRGTETTLFLSGAVRDDDTGELLLPGDLVVRPADTLHRLTVLPPRECIFAVLLQDELPDFDP